MDLKFRHYFSTIIHASSKDLQMPFIIAFLVRVISNLQIISLVLLDSILSPEHAQASLVKTIGSFLSSIKSLIMFPEIEDHTILTGVAYICYIYIFFQFIMVIYLITNVYMGSKLRPLVPKTFAFVSFIHSQVLFYPLYCFFLRLIHSHLNCNKPATSLFYCNAQWIVSPCIFAIFNLIFAFIRELYCHQLRDQKDACAIKENFYPMVVLTQKCLIIPLLYFLNDPTTVVTVLNILLCLLSYYLLQSRLSQISSDDANTLLIMILSTTLTTKFSLVYHDFVLLSILKATKLTDPFKAAHLPKLISEYLKMTKKPESNRLFGKSTLYISGFLKDHLEGVPHLESNGIPKEIKNKAYLLAKTHLEALLKIRPRNQLLLLSLVRLEMKKLKDYPKAVSLLNELRTHKLGTAMKNSVDDLYFDLEKLYSNAHADSGNKLEFLNYFKYREQTIKLKNMIKEEITQQIKLWETLSENTVSANKVIIQAERLSSLQNKIESFWQKAVQSLEKVYVGAPLLYGLYLDAVQGIPYLGSSLVKKTYKLILNKGALNREIMDIFVENSACIIASNEPEKIGKIVDTSSSVKQLFEIDKEHLIGSNINAILPKVMVQQHDQMIINFSNNYRSGMTSNFNSYAKTLGDKYFGVEITLNAFPSIKYGLNLAAYIRKVSDILSIMIVDYYGRVIECSKDVQKYLSNGSNYIDLAQICPDLVSVNQAFNVMYAPEEQSPTQQGQNEVNLLSDVNTTKYEDNRLLSVSDVFSARELLLRPAKDKEATLKFDPLSEKTLRSPGLTRQMSNFQNAMPHEEAEKICNQYKEKKKLKFHISSSANSSRNSETAIFETQIEPLVFGGSFYKIIKMKKLDQVRKKTMPITNSQLLEGDREKKIIDMIHSDAKEISFKKIAFNEKNSVAKGDIDDILDADFEIMKEVPIPIPPHETSEKEVEEDDEDEHIIDLDFNPAKTNSRKSKAASLIGSTKSARSSASRLHTFLRKPKLSRATKAAIILVFMSFLIVLISVCIDVIFTRRSLSDIEAAVGLINLTNIRLFRLIAAWRGANIVYSRSVGVRPNNAALVVQYRDVVKTSTNDMLTNNMLLAESVNNFRSSFVTSQFFEKKVSLWAPYDNQIAYGEKVDSFTASQIISVNNMYIARWTGAVTALANRTEVLFALNNTANDYLVAVSDSISDVQTFFESTQNSNINLLKVIIILENLALVIPFLSLRALFKILLDSHRDLFKVASKIPKQNIEDRLKQLNKINDYLKENIEDRLLSYQTYKSPTRSAVNHQAKSGKKNEMFREYTLKGLIWNMILYLVFTVFLVAIILTLFWLSYTNSINGFHDLHRINNQLVTTYEYGSQVSFILSYFYYVLNFFSRPEFKIMNDVPANQLAASINYLNRANDKLIEVLSLSGQGFDDPEIENLLKNNLCPYILPGDLSTCKTQTNQGSFGLLGLNSKFYQTCGLPILTYLNTPNRTLAGGIALLNIIVSILGDMHVLSIEGYAALADIIYSNFSDAVAEKTASNMTYFKYIVVTIFISVFLIGVIVIRRYKNLELAVYKILRLIPYDVIEKNKAFNFYLSKKFGSESSGLRL